MDSSSGDFKMMPSTRPNFEIGKIMRLRKFATPMVFATSIICLVDAQMKGSLPPKKTLVRLSSGEMVRVKWGLAVTSGDNIGRRMVLDRICLKHTTQPRKSRIIVMTCFGVALVGGDVSRKGLIHMPCPIIVLPRLALAFSRTKIGG